MVFSKEQHEIAREEQKLYAEKFNTKLPYSQFLKKETPLRQQIVSYEVSYQVSYSGSYDNINIGTQSHPYTFVVYGFANQKSQIETKTMDMILDSKGKNSGNRLMGGTLSAIERNAKINVKPRGMEESQYKPTAQEYNLIKARGLITKDLDTTIKMKNKKGREGELKLDVRHFY